MDEICCVELADWTDFIFLWYRLCGIHTGVWETDDGLGNDDSLVLLLICTYGTVIPTMRKFQKYI
jgi:hypothetical protein